MKLDERDSDPVKKSLRKREKNMRKKRIGGGRNDSVRSCVEFREFFGILHWEEFFAGMCGRGRRTAINPLTT